MRFLLSNKNIPQPKIYKGVMDVSFILKTVLRKNTATFVYKKLKLMKRDLKALQNLVSPKPFIMNTCCKFIVI